MNSFAGTYFDGQTSRAYAVDLLIDIPGGAMHLSGEGIERDERLADLHITSRLARIPRSIGFNDGARLLVEDSPEFDRAFATQNRLEAWVDRLERHAQTVAAALLLCSVCAVSGFLWGLPWLADRAASHVSGTLAVTLGDQVLSSLDTWAMRPSKLPVARRDNLTKVFTQVASRLHSNTAYYVIFRDSPPIGPNAFALPGGNVVVTDQLADRITDDREFIAVIAHELGHEARNHALRQTFRSSAIAVVSALFTSDVSAASGLVIGLPTFLLNGSYSREFETEADNFAFATMVANHVSPSWFAQVMRKLQAQANGDDLPAYLASHPPTAERIERAEAAGRDYAAKYGAEDPAASADTAPSP